MAQESLLPLDPAYNQLVKSSYYLNMPGYECKIVTASLVASPFATELPELVARDTYAKRADLCLLLRANKPSQLAATAASRKS